MKTIIKKQIKEILDFKNRRLHLGLTLREVESKTGISNPYLSQMETQALKKPSFHMVVKLHNFYRKMELVKIRLNKKSKSFKTKINGKR